MILGSSILMIHLRNLESTSTLRCKPVATLIPVEQIHKLGLDLDIHQTKKLLKASFYLITYYAVRFQFIAKGSFA